MLNIWPRYMLNIWPKYGQCMPKMLVTKLRPPKAGQNVSGEEIGQNVSWEEIGQNVPETKCLPGEKLNIRGTKCLLTTWNKREEFFLKTS